MEAAAGERVHVTLTVNGSAHELDIEARWLLSDVLRRVLGLTGTHVGCEHGVCGCCTVLIDGSPARSCLMFAVQAEGSDILTVESLQEEDGALHPLQESFKRHHGLQCGFCTPGFLMGALPFYEQALTMSDDEIRSAIGGQLCRCTGYAGIVNAIRDASAVGSKDDTSSTPSGEQPARRS